MLSYVRKVLVAIISISLLSWFASFKTSMIKITTCHVMMRKGSCEFWFALQASCTRIDRRSFFPMHLRLVRWCDPFCSYRNIPEANKRHAHSQRVLTQSIFSIKRTTSISSNTYSNRRQENVSPVVCHYARCNLMISIVTALVTACSKRIWFGWNGHFRRFLVSVPICQATASNAPRGFEKKLSNRCFLCRRQFKRIGSNSSGWQTWEKHSTPTLDRFCMKFGWFLFKTCLLVAQPYLRQKWLSFPPTDICQRISGKVYK